MLKASIFLSFFRIRGFIMMLSKNKTNNKERLTKTTHTRKYRLSKKNPKRLTFLLKMDMGNVEQQIRLFAPKNTEVSNLEIPKEKNPNLHSFLIGSCKLAYYKNGQKGFIYDKIGMFVGCFEKHDLIHLYNKLSEFFRLEGLKAQKTFRTTLKSESKEALNQKRSNLKGGKK